MGRQKRVYVECVGYGKLTWMPYFRCVLALLLVGGFSFMTGCENKEPYHPPLNVLGRTIEVEIGHKRLALPAVAVMTHPYRLDLIKRCQSQSMQSCGASLNEVDTNILPVVIHLHGC